MGVSTKWEVLETRLLSDNWGILKTSRLRLTFSDGTTTETWRETYDRGDGAVILPYDPVRGHVLLGRQFRWPAAYVDDPDPFLIEAAAGLLDDDDPKTRIKGEAEEELGLTLDDPTYLFALYLAPGSVTERIHFFVAPYRAEDVIEGLGGLREEGEEIEVMDVALGQALDMIRTGEIKDAKTVILLQHAALHLMPQHAQRKPA